MTTYEWSNLVVGILTFVVLSLTLLFLIRYTKATNTLARTSVEQLPRPCVVLKQSADSSVEAVSGGTACSLATEPGYNPLKFVNVGTGPAVNCRYRVVKDTEGTWYQLPAIAPGGDFQSDHPLNGLQSEDAVTVIIEYESVAGSHYRTKLSIENLKDRAWVRETRFELPKWQAAHLQPEGGR